MPSTRLIIVLGSLAISSAAGAAETAPARARWAPAVEPKPLSKSVERGLEWLVKHQLKSGGWGQGEESEQMGHGMDGQIAQANVADTCMATLALLRAGSTPKNGAHQGAIMRGLDFVMKEIESSDKDSLYITANRTTRTQSKLGPFVDTFLSAQVLAEIKDQMPDEKSEARLLAALDKVLGKIRKNQRQDGTWDSRGWAPALSQAVAGKALNRAVQAGADVGDEVRERTELHARRQYDPNKDTFSGEGSAGVGLYGTAAVVGTMADSVNSNAVEEDKVRADAEKAPTEKARKTAAAKLQRFEETKKAKEAASNALTRRLEDEGFIAGFGSNGGEEFLSYMLVSESLVAKGGKEWEKWDSGMAKNLSRIQNGDGSWTGHHCITGRTFVTAAAVLVLTADRAPVPLPAALRRG